MPQNAFDITSIPRAVQTRVIKGLETAEPGHRDVEDHDLGFELLDLLEHLPPVARLAGHLEVVLRLEEAAQALADDSVVVGNEY